jgi:hypothetical protein
MASPVSQSVCLLYDNARPHTTAVTTGTLEEMHCDVLPHPACSPDLAPSDFHLLGRIQRRPKKNRFRADDEVKVFVQRMAGRVATNFFERGIMKLPEPWYRCIGVQGEKEILIFENKIIINVYIKVRFIFELPSYVKCGMMIVENAGML